MCDADEISIYVRLAVILACLIGLVVSLILEKRNRNKSKPKKYIIISNALNGTSYYRGPEFIADGFWWSSDIRFSTIFHDLNTVIRMITQLREFYPEVSYMEFK